MNRTFVRITRGIFALVATALLFCALSAVAVRAQMFQAVYGGGGGAGESGRGGVTAVSSGGFIATGESFSASNPNSDIYVVRTDNTAALAWSYTYSIGANDSATDIIECVNHDFVIVGVTDNVGSNCLPSRDIFLLRIDSCGRVLWVNTYGQASSDEIGWEVIEAESGDPTRFPVTNIGDLIVAGSTTFNVPGVGRDGYLMRTTAGGVLSWDRQYDVSFRDDYFYGLTEARFNNLLGVPEDIVAVGGSERAPGNVEGFMVRVSGLNGTIGGAPQNASLYTGPLTDEFRSVCEIRNGATPGNLVAAGSTLSLGGAQEALLVQYNGGDPCKFNSDLVFGDGGLAGADEAYWVREDPLNGPGSIVVTGYVTLPGGLGGNDAFRHSFITTPLAPIVPGGPWVYGGPGRDWGWSIAGLNGNLPCRSPGYVIAGFTNSFTPVAGVNELYLIKTNPAGFSACNEANPPAIYRRPFFAVRCITTLQNIIMRSCMPLIRRFCQPWQRTLCYVPDGTIPGFCPGQICPRCLPDVIPPKLLNESSDEDAASMKLSSFPNPVRRGGDISLEYTAPGEGLATVTVIDMAGREVYSESAHQAAGSHSVTLGTKGWPAGAYLINVEVGGRSGSRHIEVVDR